MVHVKNCPRCPRWTSAGGRSSSPTSSEISRINSFQPLALINRQERSTWSSCCSSCLVCSSEWERGTTSKCFESCRIRSINFEMQCRFPVQLVSVVSGILTILPSLCYCSNTFKFNVSMILGIASFWTALSLAALVTYQLTDVVVVATSGQKPTMPSIVHRDRSAQ